MAPYDAKKLLSLPIIAIREGRVLGKVNELLFDPGSHVLLGVMVACRRPNGKDMFVDSVAAQRLGPYAVTVQHEADMRPLEANPRAKEIVDARIRLQGAPVLTDGGQPVGRLTTVIIDDTGSVVSYRARSGPFGLLDRHEFSPSDVIAVGEDAVIVASSILHRQRPDIAPPA